MGLFSGIGKIIKSVAKVALPAAASYATGGWSGALQGVTSALGIMQQNDAADDQARRQMEFQQYNSNTAYQRAMSDMKLAGLNPILAGSLGGASTPSGASAPVAEVGNASMQSAAGLARTAAEIQNMETTNTNIKSQTNLNKALITQAQANAGQSAAAAAKTYQDIAGQKSEMEWNANNPNTVGFGKFMNSAFGGLSSAASTASHGANAAKTLKSLKTVVKKK